MISTIKRVCIRNEHCICSMMISITFYNFLITSLKVYSSTGLFIIIGTASKSRHFIQIRYGKPSKLHDIVFWLYFELSWKFGWNWCIRKRFFQAWIKSTFAIWGHFSSKCSMNLKLSDLRIQVLLLIIQTFCIEIC